MNHETVVTRFGYIPYSICIKPDCYAQYAALLQLSQNSIQILETIFESNTEKGSLCSEYSESVVNCGLDAALQIHGDIRNILRRALKAIGVEHHSYETPMALMHCILGEHEEALLADDYISSNTELEEHVRRYLHRHELQTLRTEETKVKPSVLKNKHIDTLDLNTRSWLSRLLLAQGRLGEALTASEYVFEAFKHALGPEHSLTLLSLTLTAFILRKLRRIEEADQLIRGSEKAIQITIARQTAILNMMVTTAPLKLV